MRVSQLIKESGAFLITTALSCGPSQVFGLTKLVVDVLRITSTKLSNACFCYRLKKIAAPAGIDSRVTQNTKKLVAKKLNLGLNDVSADHMNRYLETKLRLRDEKISRLQRSLKADLSALLPLIGAHISWRIATEYKGKSCTPIFSRGIAQLCEPFCGPCSKALFWGRGSRKVYPAKPYIRDRFAEYITFAIPVETSTKRRTIDAYFAPASSDLTFTIADLSPSQVISDESIAEAFPKNPTVVLFHPASGGVASGMTRSAEAYRQMGFNVLMVTIGGYANSPGVKPSEGSAYQDIEAIKLFLQEKGVTAVGWHGWSLGTGFAIDAAAGDALEGMESLFAVAVVPYGSARSVAGNILGPLGRGYMSAACPAGRSIELPGRKWRTTDGLNSLEKSRVMKERGVDLICVEGDLDFMMGRKLTRQRKFKENFARDLLQERYSENAEECKDSLILLRGGHINLKNFNLVYEALYKKKRLPQNVMEYLDRNPIAGGQNDSYV